MRIGSTYLPMLEEFQREWGGSINEMKRKNKPDHHKDAWVWVLAARDDLIRFFEEITPYLVEKREQAEVGLEMALSAGPSGIHITDEQRAIRTAGALKLKELKHG